MSPDPVASDDPRPPAPARIRLQKFLASCGLGSRRACEEFITAGRVTVDGVAAEQLGATVDPSRQEIALDGEPLKIERKNYFALNKPRGVVCTNNDPAGRLRVIDLFPPDGPRLFPVGRLDEESEGLLIVTNDGDLAQKLAHPKYRIFRTYHVHVAGVPNRPALESLQDGYYFTEGKFRVHSAKIIKKQGQSSHLELVLTEGQNREVRRLLARIGHKVMRLKRVAFGPIQLGRLKRGEFRQLKFEELEKLHSIVERNLKAGSAPDQPQRPARGPRRSPTQRPPQSRSESGAVEPKRRLPKQTLVQPGEQPTEATASPPRSTTDRRSKSKRAGKGAVGGKPPRTENRQKPRRGAGRHRRSKK
ncbi:MAG: pseudouridine synthase [Planctomycetaceae bacterium]